MSFKDLVHGNALMIQGCFNIVKLILSKKGLVANETQIEIEKAVLDNIRAWMDNSKIKDVDLYGLGDQLLSKLMSNKANYPKLRL